MRMSAGIRVAVEGPAKRLRLLEPDVRDEDESFHEEQGQRARQAGGATPSTAGNRCRFSSSRSYEKRLIMHFPTFGRESGRPVRTTSPGLAPLPPGAGGLMLAANCR